MKLNVSKTLIDFAMRVSRSRTIHPGSTPLTLDGIVPKESDELFIVFVAFRKNDDL